MLGGAIDEVLADALEQRAERDGLAADGQLALAGARDDQQVVGHLREVVAFLDGGHERLAHVRPVVAGAQGALELGLDHRHRRAQLVAGVGDELPLAVERPPQAIEHVVERLAEPADLVVGGGQRQALVLVRQRHLGRPAAHRLDGREPAVATRSRAPTSARWPGRRRPRRR